MVASSPPLAVLLFLVVLVASAVPATVGGKYSGARMVIIRGPATTTGVASADGASSNYWQHHGRQLVEDEVAPELGRLLGAGIGYGPLDKDRPGCPPSDKASCAAKGPGEPYVKPRACTYREHCQG